MAGDELLEAAIARPGDAGALAVYADFLLERQHPLGPGLAHALADPELTYLAVERLSCRCNDDVVTHAVPVFRFEPFARAVGLADGQRAHDTELALVPPPTAERAPSGAAEPYLVARTVVTRRVWSGLPDAAAAAGCARELPAPENVAFLPDGPTGDHPALVDADRWVSWTVALGLGAPTSAEWEFAARAGTSTPYSVGDRLTADDAWFASDDSLRDGPVAVAGYPANAFGLFDAHGNAVELAVSAQRERSNHGGGWASEASQCASDLPHSPILGQLGSQLALRPIRSLPASRALVDALRESRLDVRRRAAARLGQTGAPAVALLVSALGAPGARRDAIIAAMRSVGAPSSVAALTRALADGSERSPALRRGAAAALARLGDASIALPALTAALDDPSPLVRRGAIDALGTMGDARAVPLMATLLRTGTMGFRRQACRALGRIGDPGAVPVLLETIGGGSTGLAIAALGALCRVEGLRTPLTLLGHFLGGSKTESHD